MIIVIFSADRKHERTTKVLLPVGPDVETIGYKSLSAIVSA